MLVGVTVPHMSLRDRKRARTRQALVDAATDLFERNGYEQTTVADIAAAAEIGTRTFFSYFASKEELLFPESDARVRATVEAIASRRPDEGPAEVLLRALRTVGDASDDMTGPLAALRLRLIRTVPAVRGRGLQIQLDAQREIARHLAQAFPDRLDEVGAAALTGAFIGAISGALQVLLERTDRPDDPAALHAALRKATDVALAPWLATS
jgi:AcrR family transcriptional regulator